MNTPNEPREIGKETLIIEAKQLSVNSQLSHSEQEEHYEEDNSSTLTQKIIGWLWFFFKVTLIFSFIATVVLVGIFIGVVKAFSERIPIIADAVYRPNLTSQVFDSKGRLFMKLHATENRTRILSSTEIPKIMKDSVVAIEDERFYEHYGIDVIGIARAMLANVKAGRIVQGASTLTQQLIKNVFLTNEKSYKRKAIEAMMAFQIERKYSKDEILTLYLNEIYFGHGAYGLAAAAELYFGKTDPSELTLSECAMLSSIPKSPVYYSPYKYPENNARRRELVLSKMASLGFITPSQYEEAKAQEPALKPMEKEEQIAPYFAAYIRDQLLEKYGAHMLYNGGLKIYTTIDLDFQKYAEDAMNNAAIFKEYPAEEFPDMNGALICLDPKNGHIKAMYGGRSFEQSQFNRTTQALIQTGSGFKPFVFAAALEEGYLPGDVILDEPITYTNPWTLQVWSPQNSDLKFHGYITLLQALMKSYNVPAVKLIDALTPAKLVRFIRKLGINSPMDPNLSLALGSGQCTLLELASAYGVFVNSGIYCKPVSILRVYDRENNLLSEDLPKAKEVMSAVTAGMMCDMLRNAVERGTGWRVKIKDRVVGGKTGTTNDYKEAWFNGISPELVTIVEFGFDVPKTLGKGKAGGNVAGPPWKDFMSKALEHYPKTDFPVPNNAVRCNICSLSGHLSSSACPWSFKVTQMFPVDSQPVVVCRHAAYEAKNQRAAAALEVLEEEEIADTSAAVPYDFFSATYDSSKTSVSGRNVGEVLNTQPRQFNPVQFTPIEEQGLPAVSPKNNFTQDSQMLPRIKVETGSPKQQTEQAPPQIMFQDTW